MMVKHNSLRSAHRHNALPTRSRFGNLFHRIVDKVQHNPVGGSDKLVCSTTGSRSDEDRGDFRSATVLEDQGSLSPVRYRHRGVGRSNAVDDPYSLTLEHPITGVASTSLRAPGRPRL